MTRGRCTRLLLLLVVVGVAPAAAVAQDDFYRGKTIRIVVGFSPGGGFDTFARTLGRHRSRHIPGNPTVAASSPPTTSTR